MPLDGTNYRPVSPEIADRKEVVPHTGYKSLPGDDNATPPATDLAPGASPEIADLIKKIDKVTALLDRPERWCKGVLKTSCGQHCIVGALQALDAEDLAQAIAKAIGGGRGRWARVPRRIEFFNDHPSTTHADVVRVLHRAREIIAEGRG